MKKLFVSLLIILVILTGCTKEEKRSSEVSYIQTVTDYDEKGNAFNIITYERNENDQVLSVQSKNSTSEYFYENGLEVRSTRTEKDGNYEWMNSYNDKNQLVKVEVYRDQQLTGTIEYFYDEKGDMIHSVNKDIIDSKINYETFETYDDSHNAIYTKTVCEDGMVLESQCEYENNQIVKWISYRNGAIESIHEYTYENDLLVLEKIENKEISEEEYASEKSNQEYRFEYDEKGHLLKQEMYYNGEINGWTEIEYEFLK